MQRAARSVGAITARRIGREWRWILRMDRAEMREVGREVRWEGRRRNARPARQIRRHTPPEFTRSKHG
jgi:hypothetical protein